MRQLTVVALVASVIAATACGSDPKPEPAAPAPPAASSTAPASSAPPVASAAPDAGKPDKQADCDALVDDANATLDAARISVDKVCKKDADCMPIKARACSFNCVTGAIPKAEEKDWTTALGKADVSCKKWNDNECSKLRTRPSQECKDRKVACEKGHCSLH